MTHFYKTGFDGKTQEISRQKIEEIARRNQEILESDNIEDWLEIEFVLKNGGCIMNEYEIIDNKGNSHMLKASNDSEALEIMKTRYIDYIYSITSSDSIIICRPNGYILAYIDTATGAQTIKTWE